MKKRCKFHGLRGLSTLYKTTGADGFVLQRKGAGDKDTGRRKDKERVVGSREPV